MNMGILQEVADIVSQGYGGTVGAMDRAIASKVLQHLSNRGWINSEDLARLVAAAGGEIQVPQSLLVKDAPLLQWTDEVGGMVLRTIDKDELVKEAKVNPNAETRNVDSGPINIEARSTDHHS